MLRLQSTLGNDAMAEVAQLTGLTQLSLRGCGGLTGAPGSGFECLRALQALRSLNLSQCTSLQVRHWSCSPSVTLELQFFTNAVSSACCTRTAQALQVCQRKGVLSRRGFW